MIHAALITNDWSDWFDIHNQAIIDSLPDKPGIYEIRTDFQINRLKGACELVYMGSASDSIKKRLCSKLFGSFTGLDRASK